MLRLTLILSAAIYAVLVIYSEPATDPTATATTAATPAPDVSRGAAAVDATAAVPRAQRDTLVAADGRALRIAAVINPLRPDDGGGGVHRVSTRAPDTDTVSGSAGTPDLPIVEVTGSSVNLRAGPSTGEPVLDALLRGERAELIAATGTGWSHIRTVEAGVEGYMADRFLSPVN